MPTFPTPPPDFTATAVPKSWMDQVMTAITSLEERMDNAEGGFYVGVGLPGDTLGVAGDHYLDTNTGILYQKQSLVPPLWTKVTEIWIDNT